MSKKAVIYARFSDEEQSGGYSIQAQLRACRKYADDHGHEIIAEYIDEAKSASKNHEKRDQFLEMMSAVKSGENLFDNIIIHKFDRFSRDIYQAVTQKAILSKFGVRLISVVEPAIGSDEPEDRLMEHLTIALADYYSHNLGREALKGMKEKIQEGYLVHPPPYGYKREIVENKDGKGKKRTSSIPVIDEIQAQAVRLIFSSYDRGMGYKAIAQYLNEKGFRNRNNGHFSRTSIPSILKNKAYIGILEWNKKQKGKYKGNKELIVIRDFYPQIIDEKVFWAVQERLARNSKNKSNAHAYRTQYLLSGLIFCKKCGAHYVGTSAKGGEFHYYNCQSYLRKGKSFCDSRAYNKEKLEDAIIKAILNEALTPETIKKLLKKLNEQSASEAAIADEDIQAIEREVEKKEGHIKRYFTAVENGVMEIEEVAPRIRALRQEKKSLDERKAEFMRKLHKAVDVIIPQKLVDPLLKGIKNRLLDSDFGRRKAFLEEMIQSITVAPKYLIVEYKLPIKKLQRTPSVSSLQRDFWLPGQDSNLQPSG